MKIKSKFLIKLIIISIFGKSYRKFFNYELLRIIFYSRKVFTEKNSHKLHTYQFFTNKKIQLKYNCQMNTFIHCSRKESHRGEPILTKGPIEKKGS